MHGRDAGQVAPSRSRLILPAAQGAVLNPDRKKTAAGGKSTGRRRNSRTTPPISQFGHAGINSR